MQTLKEWFLFRLEFVITLYESFMTNCLRQYFYNEPNFFNLKSYQLKGKRCIKFQLVLYSPFQTFKHTLINNSKN